MHARKMAMNAHLIITNHAMLLMDLTKEEPILPDYRYCIIDEAHHLEKTARNSFGHKVEYHLCKWLIGRLGTLEKAGLFFKLENLLGELEISPSTHSFELDHTISDMETELDDLFMLLSGFLTAEDENKSQAGTKLQIRINEQTRSKRQWKAVLMCSERLLAFHRDITRSLRERLMLLREKDEKPSDSDKAFIEEFNSFLEEWKLLGANIVEFILTPSQKEIIWMDGDSRTLPNSLSLFGQPSNAGEKMAEILFKKKNSVVLTSATLAVNGSFSYFLGQLGLRQDEVMVKTIASPFNYAEKTKLLVPVDLPEIRSSANDDYIEAIAGHIIAIAEATEGRMLVLFTSYDMLRKTYHLIKDSEALEDFVLLGQGITAGSRSRLTKSFQHFGKAILFGTSSFWEGVDIPGRDLTCLVIVRLPFSPPDEPVAEAKCQAIRQSGKNPFTEYSLPEAVIRFKQGVGRLIRSEDDKGIVIVMDRRIDTASYGKTFLRSIPDVPVERGTLSDIIETIEEWL